MEQPQAIAERKSITRWIMAGLAVCGILLAVGSYRLNHNLGRPVVVLACYALFMAAWWLVLRRGRGRRRNLTTTVSPPSDDNSTAAERPAGG